MGRQQWEGIVASAVRQALMVTKTIQPGVTIPGSGGTYTIDIFAPAGMIGFVQNVAFGINKSAATAGGAVSGNTAIMITTTQQAGRYILAEYNFDKIADFNANSFLNSPTRTEPPDVAGVTASIKGVAFDAATGLRLQITNNTPVSMVNVDVNFNVTWLKVETA